MRSSLCSHSVTIYINHLHVSTLYTPAGLFLVQVTAIFWSGLRQAGWINCFTQVCCEFACVTPSR